MKKALLVLLSAGALSCGQDGLSGACTAHAAVGLTVDVTNAATTEPLCDAKVTATDGAYSEELLVAACSYAGAVRDPARTRFAPRGPASSRKRLAEFRW